MFWARRNPSPVSGAGAGPADAGRHLRAGSQRVTACSPVRAPGAFPKCLHSDASQEAGCVGTLPALPLEFGVPRTVDIQGRLFSGGWCPGRCGLSGIPVPTHSMPGAPPVMTTTGVPRRCPASPAGGGGTYCSVLKLLFEIPCLSGHKSCCPPSEGKPPFGQDPVISVHEPRESWGPSRSWGLWAAQVARQSHGCNLSTPKPGDSGQVSRHT